MDKIVVKINNTDISTLGMTFQDGAISALMALPPAKEYITNNIPMSAGRQYVGGGYMNEMEISLPFNIVAESKAKFFEYYLGLRNLIISNGAANNISMVIEIYSGNKKHVITPNTMKYVSCTQFSHYQLDLAMFVLKVVQPVPGITVVTSNIS